MTGADHPPVEVTRREELRAWLEANHDRSGSIWLVTYKAADPVRHVPYEVVVEEALCFGWIDSLPRKLDDARSMLRLSPRKPGSAWSALNKQRVERLQAAGLMAPAGLAVVEAAKADGSWSFLDDVEAGIIPDDFAAMLDAHAPARAEFEKFPRSVRRGLLEWIKQARTPQTRARRIAETARLAQRGERANQFRKR
ncbi:MAG: YdeI/OmpD-associated family protein [Alphaproteobacteria bacterium]|nr:YdeI/OmpD-associated family protein [Alphaproteobacteria bacterium]